MSYHVLEVHVWNLGGDESEELVEEIANVLAARGLGGDPTDEDSDQLSIVALKAPEEPEVLETWMEELAEASYYICLPMVKDRAVLRRKEEN